MHPKSALVVDDNPAIRKSLVKLLRRNGYTVLEAGSGQDALKAIDEQNVHPDVILLDMWAGAPDDMDGATFLREYSSRDCPQAKVLPLTGKNDAQYVAKQLGIESQIVTPLSLGSRFSFLAQLVVGA